MVALLHHWWLGGPRSHKVLKSFAYRTKRVSGVLAMRRRDSTSCTTGAAACAAGSIIFAASFALAQQNHHPPQDQTIHERFYSTWMMPDNRTVSCCDNQDCSPAESRIEDGKWVARKLGRNDSWTVIPPEKVEHDRQSPDGRSHLCSRRIAWPWTSKLGLGDAVFCFIPGTGF